MSERKKPGPRSDINKLAIRRDYAQGLTNLTELGKKYGVQRNTIASWIKKEQWRSPKEISSEVQAEIERQVVGQAAAEVIPNVAEYLVKHSEAAKLAMQYAVETLGRGVKGDIMPGDKQSSADVFKTVMDGFKIAVATTREIEGLRPGQSSVGNASEDNQLEIRFNVIKQAS